MEEKKLRGLMQRNLVFFFLNFENIIFFFFLNKILISNFIKINILINKLKKKRSKRLRRRDSFLGYSQLAAH